MSVPREMCCFWEIPQLFFSGKLIQTELHYLLVAASMTKDTEADLLLSDMLINLWANILSADPLSTSKELGSLGRCITPGLVLVWFLPSSSSLAAFLNLRLMSSTSQNSLEFFHFFRLLHKYLSGKEKQSKFSPNFLTNCRWYYVMLCM